MSVVNSDIFVN